MQDRPYRLIDLFAGAGGFTQGFVDHFGDRVESVWANDFDIAATRTYNANFGDHCEFGDIVELLEDSDIVIPEADIVIGGPPCQGFSLLNKNRDMDPRKQLWRPYLDVVQRSRARVFVIENVRQLIGSPEHEQIVEVAKSMGFKVASEVLCAADYGVPQIRYRAFIIGSLDSDPAGVFPALRTHYNPKNGKQLSLFEVIQDSNSTYVEEPKPWRTVRDAIEDLPEPEGTEIRDEDPPLNLHFGRSPTLKSIARYKAIPDEGMNRFDLQEHAPELTPQCWIRKKSGGTDLFGRLWWDRPAFTIRTEFFKPEKGRYLHPVQHRPITHREAARFQSFPDEFVFEGKKIEIARQIGNAVPPLLGRYLASCVEKLMVDESVSSV
jgi:DNA (cytosine-5)-methyltransferase 1